jgi:hypothetical protein
MKKLLGIVVLGLLLQGCAKPVGQNYNLGEKKEFVAVANLIPSGFTDAVVTAYTLGIVSPKYYDFYEYGDTAEEAETKSMEACLKFRSKKNWEEKSSCNKNEATWTAKGSIEQPKREKALELSSMIDKAKDTCKSLGFKKDTEKYAECTLKLYTQSVELAAEKNQKVVSGGMSGNSVTIYDPVRDSDAAIKRGQGLINGTCTLGDLSNC